MKLQSFLPLFLISVFPAFSQHHSKLGFNDPRYLAPNIPTPEVVVDHMLEMAALKKGDVVYDLGCGDGRILIHAVQKFGVKGVGVEMDDDIFEQTSRNITKLGLDDKVRIIHGDALKVDLTSANVVTLYLLTSSNERLRPVLEKQLRAGSRVVSHDFEILGWKASRVDRVRTDGRTHVVYLYSVPASIQPVSVQ